MNKSTTTNPTFLERSERISRELRQARILGEPKCRNSASSVSALYRTSVWARLAKWVRSI